MFEKDSKVNEAKYTSCIKINGIPILPPLITHAKWKEMHKYKQQAIKLEKHLNRERELKEYINKYYIPNLGNCTNMFFTNTLENKLSFEEDLILEDNGSENFIEANLAKNEVPSVIQKKIPKLSCDLQVSQYTNNEFTVLTSFAKCKSDIVIVEPVFSSPKYSRKNSETDIENKVDISDVDNQKPRLIRSNSYTLETPSPMLLEHLRKRSESADIENSMYTPLSGKCSSETECMKEKGNALVTDLQQDIVTESHHSCHEDNDLNLNELNNTCMSRSESELKNISSCVSDQTSNNGDLTFIENQYHLKEFFDNNIPQVLDEAVLDDDKTKNCLRNGTRECDSITHDHFIDNSQNNCKGDFPEKQLTNCNDASLRKILNNIPEVYSKQIIELLEKQKREELIKGEKSIEMLHSCNCDNVIECNHMKKDCKYHMEPQIDSDMNQNFRKGIIQQSQIFTSSSICNSESSYEEVANVSENKMKALNNEMVLNCSSELFPNYDKEVKQLSEKEFAASVIGAAAKGYLVRRLMRTNRVQGLIQTIRDALICAMQLHSENSEIIKESDVELHRRLIQQVSAACFEFHDVFFSLNTSEQMAIIRLDRERQKEKLKRPLSRVSSAGKSSRSAKSIKK